MRQNRFLLIVGLILVLIATAACSQAAEVPQTGPGTDVPGVVITPVFDEALREQAINFLSTELGVPADQINLGNIQYMDWPDSCLGLGGAAESCAAVVTPGFQVSATVNGQEYMLRTDLQGTSLRLEGETGTGQ